MIRRGLTRTMSSWSSIVLILAAFGCAQRAPNGSHYVLVAARQASGAPAAGKAVLEVRRFSIDAEFAGRGLVYRTGDLKFESDAYRQFLIAPAQMITERMRNWLSVSGLFEQVLVPGSRIQPSHTLEGNVLALYGDLRDPDAPQALLELRCFLLATQDPAQRVVFARDYRCAKALQDKTADDLVEALDTCLVDILTRLERDIASLALGESP